MFSVMLAEPVRLVLSVAVAVMVWVPMLRLLFVKDPPVPIDPLRLDVQTRLDVTVPSCSSVAMPLNETEAPEA